MLSRSRFAVLVALATTLTLVPLIAFATSETAAPEATAPAATMPDVMPADGVQPGAAPYATAPERLSPMMRDIVAAWEASLAAVAAVEQRLAATTDPMAALDLQRQIEDLRMGVEVEMLRIQARHARQEGRLDDAAGIEAAIVEMTAPRTRGVPVDRPLPDDRDR